ncbi:hypothetical protein ERX37_06235 [Macrococcus hajekii]|uniref:Uncharacterized protein n=1 Tax=Macrococcus hajekii TaxID=198482 RepID=A0A4R6BJC0_9STAP|nr:hypothetical protein [Macrococcus hajekii]TDM01803.1 hypothetical protein ERX37_06235 [Macrococcus hajekii]GGB07608.1 hypothetical protein GCM10007190_14490 [Macrococcus hajekii]
MIIKADYNYGKKYYKTYRHYDKGTFKSRAQNAKYHYKKHGVKGRYSVKRYTQRARTTFKANKRRGNLEKVRLSNGKKGYRVRGKNGGYYTKRGKIVSYHNNKYRKEKSKRRRR